MARPRLGSSEQGLPPWLEPQEDFLLLDVEVVPSSPRTRVMGTHDGRLRIQLEAASAADHANVAVIRFLADTLDVPTAQVAVVGGLSNRRKTVRLLSVSVHRVLFRLTPPKVEVE